MAQHTVVIDKVCIYLSGKNLLSPLKTYWKDWYTHISSNRAIKYILMSSLVEFSDILKLNAWPYTLEWRYRTSSLGHAVTINLCILCILILYFDLIVSHYVCINYISGLLVPYSTGRCLHKYTCLCVLLFPLGSFTRTYHCF